MAKTPTIYDVSEKAGVSTATVSRVLNNPGKVNSVTRETVENAIRELGYRPLLEARLRTAKDVRRICVCAPHFTANSFVQRLRGIAATFAGRNYELQVYSVASKNHMDQFIEMLELNRMDGIITLSLPFTEEQIHRINMYQIEMAMIEYSSPLVNCVVINDREGGRLAAEYLINKGRQRFGIACELSNRFDYSVYPIMPRLESYREELDRHGFDLSERYIYDVLCDTDATYHKFLEVFRSGDYPDAIFATADLHALGILRAAKETNVRVPEDVAVIGFDDIDFADYVGLTTIRQNLDQSGRIAADLLTNRMKDPSRPLQHVQLPLTIIERETA